VSDICAFNRGQTEVLPQEVSVNDSLVVLTQRLIRQLSRSKQQQQQPRCRPKQQRQQLSRPKQQQQLSRSKNNNNHNN